MGKEWPSLREIAEEDELIYSMGGLLEAM